MEVHPKFLKSTLPLFYEEVVDVEGAQTYTDSVTHNTLAYVQTPQYFKKNDLIASRGDVMRHEMSNLFGVRFFAWDGFGSAMFCGTNCVWRRAALDSVGGIQCACRLSRFCSPGCFPHFVRKVRDSQS